MGDWTELLASDEALAAAILNRLLRKAHVLKHQGQELSTQRPEATLGTTRS